MTRLLHFILLFLFLTLLSALRVGSPYDVLTALANIFTDDTSLFYSAYLKNPDAFAGDIYATIAPTSAWASIANWLPYVVEKYFSIPSLSTIWVIMFSHEILLGFSLFLLSFKFSKNLWVSWVTVLLAFAFEPWGWNLMHYGSSLGVPLATQLSLPLVVFAWLAQMNASWLFVPMLFLLALLHPSMALCATYIFGFFWLVTKIKERKNFFDKNSQQFLLGTASVLGVVGYTYLSLQTNTATLSKTEILPLLEMQPHMTPWRYGSWLSFNIPLGLTFLIMTLSGVTKEMRAIYFTLLAAALSFLTLAFIGHAFKIVPLIQLMPMRSSMLFLLLALPFWAMTLTLEKKLTPLTFMRRLVMALLLYNLYVRIQSPTVLYLGTALLLLKILEFLPIAFLQKSLTEIKTKTQHQITLILVIILVSIAIFRAHRAGQSLHTDARRANLELQIWARDHLPKESWTIINGHSWRTVTGLRAIEPHISFTFVYNKRVDTFELEYRFPRKWNIEKTCLPPNTADQCYTAMEDSYWHQTAYDWKEFRNIFGGDYIVRPNDKLIDAPIVFKNQFYSIQALNQ